MDTKMKFRFPHSLFSTLTSCKTQNLISDVTQQTEQGHIVDPQSFFLFSSCSPKSSASLSSSDPQIIPHSSNSIEPLLAAGRHSPGRRSGSTSTIINQYGYHTSSKWKPRCPGKFDEMVRDNCIFSTTERSKRIFRSGESGYPGFRSGDVGRKCPPPGYDNKDGRMEKTMKLAAVWKEDGMMRYGRGMRRRRRRRRRTNEAKLSEKKKPEPEAVGRDLKSYYKYEDCFSSDDEREYSSEGELDDDDTESESELETLFSSSRSLLSSLSSSKSVSYSSNSDTNGSASRRRWSSSSRRRRKKGGHNNGKSCLSREGGVVEEGSFGEVKSCLSREVGVVEEGSFAVVKSSSDPYGDFRNSMVEMVMERQIFGADGLEELLECFLSLNSAHHHRVIIEVFTEIWDALFSN